VYHSCEILGSFFAIPRKSFTSPIEFVHGALACSMLISHKESSYAEFRYSHLDDQFPSHDWSKGKYPPCLGIVAQCEGGRTLGRGQRKTRGHVERTRHLAPLSDKYPHDGRAKSQRTARAVSGRGSDGAASPGDCPRCSAFRCGSAFC